MCVRVPVLDESDADTDLMAPLGGRAGRPTVSVPKRESPCLRERGRSEVVSDMPYSAMVASTVSKVTERLGSGRGITHLVRTFTIQSVPTPLTGICGSGSIGREE